MLLLLSFMVGLVIGSFLNVVIYRLPLSIQGKQYQGKSYSVIHPMRSICPDCQTQLSFLQLIPLLSFVLQKGQCHDCRQKIAWQYPTVELFCGLVTVLLFQQFGISQELLFYSLYCYIVTALLIIDFKHHLLPDVLTLSLLYLGLLFHLDNHFNLVSAVIGAVVGYLSLWGIYWLFKLIRGKEGFGYGDFKLTAALGAWLGWQSLPITITIACVLALTFALFRKLKLSQRFAFGPFLLLAGTILLFTHKIIP